MLDGFQELLCLVRCSYGCVATDAIVWDTRKAAANRSKHGISFTVAARVFDDPNAVSYVERVVDGETRWQTIGIVVGLVVVLVAHTVEEGDEEETIRIISARKANRREQALYLSSHEG